MKIVVGKSIKHKKLTMKIKTKFDKGNMVFAISFSRIIRCEILNFRIVGDSDSAFEVLYKLDSPGDNSNFCEEELFNTIDELLANLKDEYNIDYNIDIALDN